MGAWDIGSFENDDAADWLPELEESEGVSILEDAFARIIDTGGYLEVPDCSIAIAAAEVVAALRKRPSDELPDSVGAFVARAGSLPSPELVASASKAVARIAAGSELQELWADSDQSGEWLALMSALQARLK
jgi:hypothetical protein